jgi:hypothetical protein
MVEMMPLKISRIELMRLPMPVTIDDIVIVCYQLDRFPKKKSYCLFADAVLARYVVAGVLIWICGSSKEDGLRW